LVAVLGGQGGDTVSKFAYRFEASTQSVSRRNSLRYCRPKVDRILPSAVTMAKATSLRTTVLLLAFIGFASASNDIGKFLINSKLEINVKSLLSEICGTNSTLLSIALKSLSNDYSDRTVENLCRNETTDVLLWIPVGNFGNLAEVGSSSRYLGKSTGDEDFAEYCSYDVTTRACTTDNGVVEGAILVLAEKYPERYELRDLVYKKWTNSTRLGSPILAYATLKNREPAYKYVDQDISYLADTRIDYVLPTSVTHGVQLSVYRGKTETYKLIAGETYYSRNFKVIETKLTETHVEYALPVNLYDAQSPAVVPLIPNQPSKESNNGNQGLPPPKGVLVKPENIHIHINELDIGQAYPGFRNVAIGAAILFFSVLGLALLDIIRRSIAMRRAKRLHIGKYSRT
uniref:Uncharacterized protein n=1 Tax=Anopheles atroparvus TaxID=41427 RepID=A0A182J0G2_ANOAO